MQSGRDHEHEQRLCFQEASLLVCAKAFYQRRLVAKGRGKRLRCVRGA